MTGFSRLYFICLGKSMVLRRLCSASGLNTMRLPTSKPIDAAEVKVLLDKDGIVESEGILSRI